MRENLQRWFWILVGIFGLADLASFGSFQVSSAMPWIFSLGLIGILALGWKWPWLPALVSLGELVVGGKGYLWYFQLGGERISFRLGLFFVLLVLAGVTWWRRRQRIQLPLRRPLLAYAVWILIMAGVGWSRGYGWSQVFLDVNGFLFLGIVIPWVILLPTKTDWKDWVLVTLLAGASYLGVKTWLMLYLFSHQPAAIETIYHWVRNSGVGEITRIQDPVYRVFFQSHIYSLMLWLATLGGFLWAKAPRWWMWPMLCTAFGTYMSLSRSFWIGAAAGMVVLFGLSWRQLGWSQLRRWLIVLPIAAASWLIGTWAIEWPYMIPNWSGQGQNIVVSRLTAKDAVAASSARANQLGPLHVAIRQAPLTGYGFGKTVTYYSTDPRVKGWRTTAAFELGYHDLVLKIGLIGLGLFGWLALALLKIVWRSPQRWLWIGGTIGLGVVHITTPYLNHPLGLGWLVLTAIAVYDNP